MNMLTRSLQPTPEFYEQESKQKGNHLSDAGARTLAGTA